MPIGLVGAKCHYASEGKAITFGEVTSKPEGVFYGFSKRGGPQAQLKRRIEDRYLKRSLVLK